MAYLSVCGCLGSFVLCLCSSTSAEDFHGLKCVTLFVVITTLGLKTRSRAARMCPFREQPESYRCLCLCKVGHRWPTMYRSYEVVNLQH